MRTISVFIPAYNASSGIECAVRETDAFLCEHFDAYEIVVVDDCSTDGTAELLTEIGKTVQSLRIVQNDIGPSRRENLAKAMAGAHHRTMLFMDADLAVGVEAILPAHDAIRSKGHDIAIASRYAGIRPQRSLYRLLLSRTFNLVLRLMFRSKVSDHICGFKAFDRDVFRKLQAGEGYDATFSRGWFWDAQMLILAQRQGFRIAEIPVAWMAGKESTFNLRREMRMIPVMIAFFIEINGWKRKAGE